jgi:Dolichyl-phosphate-mannose-protein mannosyltransferase
VPGQGGSRASVAAPVPGRPDLWIDRAAERAAAIPTWLVLGGVVAVSAVVRFVLSLSYPSPWTWTDELLYGELAKSFAATGHFAIRDVPGHAGFGVVYPILISPAYALFTSIPAAYTFIKAINAVVMSLAAVPTYLLARRLVGRWFALTAALLVLALPGLAFTAQVMTENAFFTVFVFWCWTLVRALERPSLGRQVAAIALLVVLYLTRPQGILLVPALLTAVVLVTVLDALAARERRFGPALLHSAGRYAATWVIFATAGGAYLVLQLVVRGETWREALFGPTYAQLGAEHYSVTDVSHWLVYHAGELAFSVAVIPFAALLLVVFAGLDPRERWRELRVLAAVLFSASAWLLVGVAAFATTPYAQRLVERDVMYLQPLSLIALMVCVGSGLLWRRRTSAAVAALVTVGCVGAAPFASFLTPSAANDSFSVLALESVLDRHLVGLGQLQTAVIAGAVIAATIFLLVPRRLALILPACVLLAFALANGPVHRRTQSASMDARLGGVQGRRDWIDRALGTKPVVTALWSGRAAFVTLWDNEFFNRSVGKVYNFFGPPDGLPQQTVTLNSVTGGVRLGTRPLRVKYLLADFTTLVKGTPVAQDKKLGMTVYRVDGPLVLQGQIQGVYPDKWSGPAVTYDQYRCRGGTLTATLLSDRDLHPVPQTIVARSGNRELTRFTYKPGTAPRKMTTPLVAAGGTCSVTFDVPAAIPQQVTGLPDTRPLGVRFLRFAYHPARR